MKIYSYSPIEMVVSLLRNRDLIRVLIRREILSRYQGSVLGIIWSLINPVLMLCIYTFVFSIVFKARWSPGSESKTEFALILFAGLIVFNLFADCIGRTPGIIVGNANYVKKVVFPLEILPIVPLGAAIFHAMISVGVWLAAYVLLFGVPHPTIYLIVVVLLPLVLFSLGAAWFLASCGVFLRDISQLVTILTGVLIFLSPVFYPISALPEKFQIFLKFNPLTMVIEQARDVLFWNRGINFAEWGLNLLASIVTAWIGFVWFQRTRKGFADVL